MTTSVSAAAQSWGLDAGRRSFASATGFRFDRLLGASAARPASRVLDAPRSLSRLRRTSLTGHSDWTGWMVAPPTPEDQMALPRGCAPSCAWFGPGERSLPIGGKLPLTNIGAGTSASSSPCGRQSIGPRQPVTPVRHFPTAAQSTLARSAFIGTMYGSCARKRRYEWRGDQQVHPRVRGQPATRTH